MVVRLIRFGSLAVFLLHIIIACMGGCLGCHNNPKLLSSVDKPLRGKRSQGQTASKPRSLESFWTTSICDMDNSRVQSQGSISSLSTSTQMPDPHGFGCPDKPSEFINHGLSLWNQTRQHWTGTRKVQKQTEQLREPMISWKATYNSLLGSNKPFTKPIPLDEMVDFLVDIWEQEGLYD